MPKITLSLMLIALSVLIHGADEANGVVIPVGSTARVVLLTGVEVNTDGSDSQNVLLFIDEITIFGESTARRTNLRVLGTATAQPNSDRIKISVLASAVSANNGNVIEFPLSGWVVNNTNGKPGVFSDNDSAVTAKAGADDTARLIAAIGPTVSVANGQAGTLVIDRSTEVPGELFIVKPPAE